MPRAVVRHPWWNGGARSYARFFRWAYGDSHLPSLHPRHRYRNFPTLPEVWFGLVLLVPIFASRDLVLSAGLFLIGSAAIEFVVDYMKLSLRRLGTDPVSSVEATVVRLSNDMGRLASHVRHLRFAGLLERFDYFGTGESIHYERIVSGAKFLAWLVLACVLFT